MAILNEVIDAAETVKSLRDKRAELILQRDKVSTQKDDVIAELAAVNTALDAAKADLKTKAASLA